MKWSVITLVVLGAFAATAAALLVSSLRASGRQSVTQELEVTDETTIVVAIRDIPQGTVIDRDAIETQQLLIKDMPQGGVGDPEDAVFRVLAKPIKKGDRFLEAMFAKNLGQAVPNGKMLVDVPVHESSALLYLDCKVNVIWTSDPNSGGQAESTRLLSGISVWGIGDRTIMSLHGADGQTGRSSGRAKTVMLLLDMDQTQRITAFMQSGTLSLALCNPDDIWTTPEPESPAEEPQAEAEPAEEWEGLQINGDDRRSVIWVKEGSVWRLRENPE